MTERREPAQFLFLVARNGNAIGHFAHPECLNCEGAVGCVVGERESNSLSLSLEKNFEFHPPSRDERRRRRGERKGEKFFELDDYSN